MLDFVRKLGIQRQNPGFYTGLVLISICSVIPDTCLFFLSFSQDNVYMMADHELSAIRNEMGYEGWDDLPRRVRQEAMLEVMCKYILEDTDDLQASKG